MKSYVNHLSDMSSDDELNQTEGHYVEYQIDEDVAVYQANEKNQKKVLKAQFLEKGTTDRRSNLDEIERSPSVLMIFSNIL